MALSYIQDTDFKGLVRLYKFINNNWIKIGTSDLSGDNVQTRFGFSIALSSLHYYNRNNNYDISYKLVTQSYALNYTSIFVYGLAAIKELHAKVKAQEATLLEQQTIITSLTTRMEALENINQV